MLGNVSLGIPVQVALYTYILSFSSPCHAKYGSSNQLSNPLTPNAFSADYAIANKLTPFISMQNHYSLIYREEEREMVPTLKVCVSTYTNLPVHDEHPFPPQK
jgi:hypothetical protein